MPVADKPFHIQGDDLSGDFQAINRFGRYNDTLPLVIRVHINRLLYRYKRRHPVNSSRENAN